MTQFHQVTDQFSVSPQISVADVDGAAGQGFRLIINNRPDGEDPGQPSGHEIEAAAAAAGVGYVHIPVRGMPSREQVESQRQVIAAADGPVLAYCRSGNRSIVTWAIGEALSGDRSRDELVRLGRSAGYDLSGVLPG
jgi:uncharacterized protein (TIGR01244 family)